MTVITPVGGIIGPRPTGASFRTGVWKQQEVFVLRQDGVWQTPLYPDLAPYATNANGEILAAVFDPTITQYPIVLPRLTTDYVKPRTKPVDQDISIDAARSAIVVNQAVNNNINWRFTFRYYDEPDGANIFGLTPQSNNLKRVSSGNSSDASWENGYGFGFLSNFTHMPTIAWGDYVYRNYIPEENISSFISKQNSRIRYQTSYSTDATRWPFGQGSTYVGNYAGYNLYRNDSDIGRSVALWLLPPP
jgi:hypothetical protein